MFRKYGKLIPSRNLDYVRPSPTLGFRSGYKHAKVDGSAPVIDSGLICSEKGTTRAEDAQGTPIQRHISLSILVYADKMN